MHREITSLKSSHSLQDELTLLHVSQRKVSVYACNQLLNKISARTKRETGVNVKRFLMIKCPALDQMCAENCERPLSQPFTDPRQ